MRRLVNQMLVLRVDAGFTPAGGQALRASGAGCG